MNPPNPLPIPPHGIIGKDNDCTARNPCPECDRFGLDPNCEYTEPRMKTPIELLHMADQPLTGWRLRLVKEVLNIVKTERVDHVCEFGLEELCSECIKINGLSMLLNEDYKEIQDTAPVYGHLMTTLGRVCQVMEKEQWDGDTDSDCFGDERSLY